MAHANGGKAAVFAHFANANRPLADIDALAQDGVSCTVCHQIAPDRLGTRDSFNGNFVVAAPGPDGMRQAFGPLAVDARAAADHALGDRLRAGRGAARP